jgi:hypothetical protein
MLAVLRAGFEYPMTVDTTPGRYILQRPRIRANRLQEGPWSQFHDPVLDPDDRERAQEVPTVEVNRA